MAFFLEWSVGDAQKAKPKADLEIGKRLREAFKGDSVPAAAAKLRVPYRTIKNYIDGTRLDIHVAAKVHEVYGTDLYWLMTGKQSADFASRSQLAQALSELETLVPTECHGALSDCIEILTFDGHAAAKEARELLAKQVKPTTRAERAADTAAVVSDTGKDWRSRCHKISVLAKKIMDAHQSGVPMSRMVELAKTWPQGQRLTESLIVEAYGRPRYTTVEFQRRSIERFRDEAYVECAKTGSAKDS